MVAPESIVEDDLKNLYIGTRDGKIVKVQPSLDGVIGEGKMEVMIEGKVHPHPVASEVTNAIPLGK